MNWEQLSSRGLSGRDNEVFVRLGHERDWPRDRGLLRKCQDEGDDHHSTDTFVRSRAAPPMAAREISR